MAVIGIDPGKSGGIALRDGAVTEVWKMPATDGDVLELLRHLWGCCSVGDPVYLEIVGPSRGQDDNRRQGVSSAFEFGRSYGKLEMGIQAVELRLERVAPATWQRFWKLPTLKQAGTPTAKKNEHKARAQELFPQLKITHAVADALLIAEYGRRQQLK